MYTNKQKGVLSKRQIPGLQAIIKTYARSSKRYAEECRRAGGVIKTFARGRGSKALMQAVNAGGVCRVRGEWGGARGGARGGAHSENAAAERAGAAETLVLGAGHARVARRGAAGPVRVRLRRVDALIVVYARGKKQ